MVSPGLTSSEKSFNTGVFSKYSKFTCSNLIRPSSVEIGFESSLFLIVGIKSNNSNTRAIATNVFCNSASVNPRVFVGL